jgi:hypothetical protein
MISIHYNVNGSTWHYFCGSNFHAPENIFKPFGYVFNTIGIIISQGKQKKAYASEATIF